MNFTRQLKHNDPRGIPLARTEYGEDGRISAITDAEGNRTQILRSITPTNAVERIIDPLGYTNTTVADLRGNPIATTNALGGITLMAYDDLNNKTNEIAFLDGQPYATNSAVVNDLGLPLVSINALGHSNLFTWNTNGLMLSHTDAKGNTSTNFYSDNGLPTGAADAQGNTTTNIYNECSLVVASREKDGSWTTNTWDDVGNLIGTSTWGETNGTWGIVSSNSAAFDLNGNQLQSVSWKREAGVWIGCTNWSLRDAMNRVTADIDPHGHTNRTIFDVSGAIAATINKLGHATTNTLDWNGRTIKTTHPDGTSDQTQFNANGVATNRVNRAGYSTQSIPDALGRIEGTIFADGTTNRVVFDELNRPKYIINARGVTNAPGYNAAGQRVAMTNAWGTAEQQVFLYGLDPNGNQIWSIGPDGKGETNVFDALDQMVATIYADGTTNSVGYNAGGHKIAETNRAGIVTLFGMDALGQLFAVTNAFGTTNQTITRFVSDLAGNQIEIIDANGNTNKFGFNLLRQKIWHELPDGQREYFSYNAQGNNILHTNFNGVVITNDFDVINRLTNTTSVGGYRVARTYTLTGKPETIASPDSFVEMGYTLRDLLAWKTVTWSNGPSITLNYGRNANGTVTNICSSTPNGVNLTYALDALDRITNVLANGQLAAAYTFDLAGNLAGVKFGNGTTNLAQFDSRNQLTDMLWKLGSTEIASFHYQLGKAGNRTNLNETVNGASQNYAWTYDTLYRLRGETISGFGSVGYDHDSVGNRTNRTSSIAGLPNQNFTYSSNDWLDSDSYDSNGNTIGSGGHSLGYDPLNHLTNFNDSLFYGYDGDENRITKFADGVTTYFLIDDQNPTGYAQVLEEWTAFGGNTNLNHVYNFGLSLISQRDVGGPTYYFISDGHGSTRLLTHTNAAVVNAFTFDAFGNLISSNGPPQTAHLYCGEYFDSNLKAIYLRARLDNPQTGRFLTGDCWLGNNQDPGSLHKYLYAAGDPVNNIDPSGHMIAGIAIDLGGIRGGLGGFAAAAVNMAKAKVIAKIAIVSTAAAVTLAGDSSNNSNNSMRLQLQEGESHYWSLPMSAPSRNGVSSAQVRAGLGAMHAAALTDTMLLPFPNYLEPELYRALIRFSQRITPIVAGGGVVQGGNVLREEFIGRGNVFRIDLENLRGHNLRQ